MQGAVGAWGYLIERGDDVRGASESRGFEWRDHFVAETDRALDLLASILPEISFLSDEETIRRVYDEPLKLLLWLTNLQYYEA
jgi:hypothetical protein